MLGKLGIVGGGQLGKMLAIAASNLGIESVFIDPSHEAVAKHVATQIKAEFGDQKAIKQLFAECSAVTFEFENVNLQALKEAADVTKLAPNLEALYIANDRIREKAFFQECGLEVGPYRPLPDCSALDDKTFFTKVSELSFELGFPVIIKTCSLGYDGKGQLQLLSKEDLQTKAAELLQLKTADRLIIEKKLDFEFETSIILARSISGEIKAYPSPINVHKQGILFSSTVTAADLNPVLVDAATKVANKLNYVGILAIEFFCFAGKYLVNEMAPRVHNSGHWTIEAAITSQFENHVRAVMNLPLGSADLRSPVVMFNIIGNNPDSEKILKIPGAHLHMYGKEPRPGRKLGHVTIESSSREKLDSIIENARTSL